MELLPQLVKDVLAEYGVWASAALRKGGAAEPKKQTELADKFHLSVDTIRGILTGRYDEIAGINRNGSVRVMQKDKSEHNAKSVTMLYDEKGYVPSGKSFLGALELSTDGHYVKCHECGEWHTNLGAHVKSHNLTATAYKEKHGLRKKSCLLGEEQRVRMSTSKKYYWEKMTVTQKCKSLLAMKKGFKRKKKKRAARGKAHTHNNVTHRCNQQIVHDVTALYERLGQQPTTEDLEKNGLSYPTLAYRFGGIAGALNAAGIELTRKVGFTQRALPGERRYYTPMELLAALKEFRKTHGRVPTASDSKRGLLPSSSTYIRVFGSWNKALTKAGLSTVAPSLHRAKSVGPAGFDGTVKKKPFEDLSV